MTIITKALSSLCLVSILSACGGSSTSGNTTPTFNDLVRESLDAEETFERVAGDFGFGGMPGTAYSAIPTSGTATFTGPGTVSIFEREVTTRNGVTTTEDESVVDMIGDATVRVNFGNGNFAGQINSLTAVNRDLEVGNVTGSVRLINGAIGAGNFPNELSGRYSANLTAFGETYQINDSTIGILRGTRVNPPGNKSPVRALSLTGFDGQVRGTNLLADVFLVGEN